MIELGYWVKVSNDVTSEFIRQFWQWLKRKLKFNARMTGNERPLISIGPVRQVAYLGLDLSSLGGYSVAALLAAAEFDEAFSVKSTNFHELSSIQTPEPPTPTIGDMQ